MEAIGLSLRPSHRPQSFPRTSSSSPFLCGRTPSSIIRFGGGIHAFKLHRTRKRRPAALTSSSPSFRLVASLNSGQILVVLIAAVSAISYVYLNYFSTPKKFPPNNKGSRSLTLEQSEKSKERVEEQIVDAFHLENEKEVEPSMGEAREEVFEAVSEHSDKHYDTNDVFDHKDNSKYHHQLHSLEKASLDLCVSLHNDQHSGACFHFEGNGDVSLPLHIIKVSEPSSESDTGFEHKLMTSSSDSPNESGKGELHLVYESISTVPNYLQSGIPELLTQAAYRGGGHHISASTRSDTVVLASGRKEETNGSLLHHKKSNGHGRTKLGRGKTNDTCDNIELRSYHNPQPCVSRRRQKETPLQQLDSYQRLLRRGRLKEGLALLEQMDKEGQLDMNKVYHSKFLSLCRSQKAVNEAFRFVKLIPNPTLSTFNMLMSVCSSSQNSEGVAKVWQLVKEAGFKADCKLYTTMVSTYGKSGKVDAMFKVFHEMVNDGVEPNLHTYGALIDGCGRSGQIAKAFGAYGILRSKKVMPDRVIFNALITACSQSGAVDRAFDVLQEMRAEPHSIDPDHFTIGSLMKACTSAGQVDRVEEVYEMIQQYNIKGTPELYTIAVSSCSQTGDWTFACNIYNDMRKNGVEPDDMFLSTLVDVAGHAGNIDAAFEVLHEAKMEGMKIGMIPYSSLMGACCTTKSWRKALELYEEIKAMKLLPTVTTMNALITVLCEGNQLQKALEVFIEMKNMGLSPNDITYSLLFVASEKNDDLDAGLMLLSQTKTDGYPLNTVMSKCLIALCSRRFQKSAALGEVTVSFKSGKPQIDNKWTSLAVMIYREAVAAGMTPCMEDLSQVLGCLQLPANMSLRESFVELVGVDIEPSGSANFFSLIDGFGEYDLRAFSLLEEAASLGIVPIVSFKRNPILIDARKWQIHVGEVYLLTILKGLKHRLAAGAKLPTVSILLPVEEKKIVSEKGDKTTNIAGRVGQAIGAMLRRRGLPYHGNESYGKIRLSGRSVKRWFQPKSVSAPFLGKPSDLGLSAPNLGKQIADQQRNIRTENFTVHQ